MRAPSQGASYCKHTEAVSKPTPRVHDPGRCCRGRPTCNFTHVKIEKGRRVTLKVDLSVVDGAQLEKSTVEFIQGSGTMLTGIEKVLEGLEKGAKRDGVLKAKDAFGATELPPKKLKRSEFPRDAKLVVGEKFAGKGENGMNVILKIEKVSDTEVDVRYIHPLAEKDIKYSVEVIAVSDPRPPPMPAAALELEEEK
jgi:FKBP-type peptidyl-prolyl cis-trans isomerase SlyD